MGGINSHTDGADSESYLFSKIYRTTGENWAELQVSIK